MRHKTKVAAIAAAAVIAVSGIAATAWAVSGHHPSAVKSVRTTQAAAPAPAGCQQATLVTAAISSNLRANPGATAVAFHQIRDMARSLPDGQLKLDVDKAALDLAFFREYAAMGGPATRAAKNFAADLSRIKAECA